MITEAMVDAAAKAAYGDHFERYRKMMLKALTAAFEQEDRLKRCTICGFVIDTSFAAEKPTVRIKI